MNLIKEKFTCKVCNLIFETPIFLPCFNTICKKHFNEFIHKPCIFCKQKHDTPNDGIFKTNDILNDIILSEGHLQPKEKEAKIELENANQELNKLYEKFENKESSLEVFSYDHFADVMNKIEIQREELKIEVDILSEKLVNQVKACKNKFKEHIQETSKDFRNAFDKEKINQQQVEMIKEFRVPLMLDMGKLESLKVDTKRRLDEIKAKLSDMEMLEADVKKCSIEKNRSKLDEKIFGKLALVNPNMSQSIISGSYDGEIKIWSTTGECYDTFIHHKIPVISLLLLADQMLAIGYANGYITIWCLNTSAPIQSFLAHNGSITDFLLLSNEVLVSSSRDCFLKFWNLKSRKPQCLKEIQEDSSIECMVLVDYTENDIFCFKDQEDQTGILKLFHNKILIFGKLIDEDDPHLSLSALFMNQTNKNLQSLILLESNKNYNRKSIRPRGFRANNITRFSQIHNPFNAKKHLILLKNAFLLFVFKETIHQFDGMLNGNHLKLGKLSTTKIKDFILSNINRSSNNGMLFSPNSTRTSSSIFGDPRIGFNVQESDIEIISIIPSIQSRLCGLSELPNNELAVSLNNEIIVINLTNNQQIKLSDHGDLVNDLKLSLKNNLLLSCSSDKSLKIWDLMKKTCINTLIGHKNPVTTCIISEFVIKSKQSPLITQKLKVGIEKSEYSDDS